MAISFHNWRKNYKQKWDILAKFLKRVKYAKRQKKQTKYFRNVFFNITIGFLAVTPSTNV